MQPQKINIPSSLVVWYTNADVLTQDKIVELMMRIKNSDKPPHLIAICEVKPKNYNRKLEEIEYKIKDYSLVHENLNDPGQTRGLAVYVHDSLTYRRINTNEIPGEHQTPPKEFLAVEIKLKNHEKMLFSTIYRSPSSSTEENDQINKLFTKLGSIKNYTHKVIVGDFNRKNINWTNMTSSSKDDNVFIEAVRDSYLLQQVSSHTRGRSRYEPSLIDLIFTNSNENIDCIENCSPLGKSDHSLLALNFECQPEQQPSKYICNFKKANFEEFRNQFSINWDEYFNECNDDAESMWKKFLSLYTIVETDCIPKRLVKTGKRNFQFVLDRKTLSKRKKKDRLWKRYLSTRQVNVYEEYCRCRNQVRWLTRKNRKRQEKEIAKKVKSNCKAFWTYVNSKTKIKPAIPDLILSATEDKIELTKSDLEKANAFAKFFSSVFVIEPDLSESTHAETNHNTKELKISITEEIVLNKLKQLNVNKSPGPDQIHPRIVKELADVLAHPLYLIFRSSLKNGKVPLDWKTANITAIFKKGDKQLAENYRPVSLTSIVCKILESIIRNDMIAYLKENKILSNKQFGFLSGRSTTLQLLQVMDAWVNIVDNGGVVDAIYCDFRKAFDTVPHKRLILALKKIGIKDPLLSWLIDYLNHRKQRVRVNGIMSDIFDVTSGVPQGSVLGPLLFVIFINTLVKEADDSEIFLYADDLKLFKEICSNEDQINLQNDLNKLQDWTKSSLLKFHPNKCEVLRISPKRKQLEVDPVYHINNEALNTVTEVNDLGITFDHNLSFESHILKKVKKANGLAGMIRRTFSYLDKETFRLLFVSIIRPHLEYGAPIWNTHQKKLVKTIENVQRRATKLLPGMKDLSYKDRLKSLKLPTLQYRRYRGDMIEMFKLTHDHYDKDAARGFVEIRSGEAYYLRKHAFAVTNGKWKTNLKRFSFKCRVSGQWNNLPTHVVNAESLNTFKNRLDKVWLKNDRMFDIDADLPTLALEHNNRDIITDGNK